MDGKARRVLMATHRFHLMTEEILRLRLFDNDSAALARTMEALRNGEYISAPRPLYAGASYFVLTQKAHQELLDTDRSPRVYSLAPLLRDYALLSFCCLGKTFRYRLTLPEVSGRQPGVLAPGLRPLDWYRFEDEEGGTHLGFACVDTSQPHVVPPAGKPPRAVTRLRDLISKHARNPQFRTSLEAGQIQCTVLTSTAAKRSELQAWLRQRPTLVRPKIIVISALEKIYDAASQWPPRPAAIQQS